VNISVYKTLFLDYLREKIKVKDPVLLYEPIIYILNLGGKRLRPIVAMLSCEVFGGNYKNALDAALAIEMFHNFSLVHDDIMDEALLRRGKVTVHEKWNDNTAILSGDAMLVLANQLLESYDSSIFKSLTTLFNKTALEVCEGQQYDMDFELSNNVTINDYLKMIKLKTAVLVATSFKMGSIIANASEEDSNNIYDFGLNLGIAFQLQDDYLDCFGNQETFGKQIGGDIINNKKTFLYLNALEKASKKDKELLLNWFSNIDKLKNGEKVKSVVAIYKKYYIPDLIKAKIQYYTNLAFASLNKLQILEEKKEILKKFGLDLMNRKL